MERNFFVVIHIRACFFNEVVPGILTGRKLLLKSVKLCAEHFFSHCIDIAEIVIKSFTVDAAVVNNILDGNFIKRFFLQKLQK